MTVSFKPVRDIPERMAIASEFLKKREPLYGSQDRLIERIQNGDVKCRLIQADGKYEGLFAYTNRENETSIDCFAPLDPSRFKNANIALDELVDMAGAQRSFRITLHKTQQALIRFFADQGFKQYEANEAFVFLEKTRKRGREEPLASPRPPAAPRPPVFRALRQLQPLSVTLKQPYVTQIKTGHKTVEGRINSGMFRNVRAGANIRFFNHQAAVDCTVQSVMRYNSFRQMLEAVGFQACIPSARTLEEAVRIYDNIPGYAEKAAQHGVLAIRVAARQ